MHVSSVQFIFAQKCHNANKCTGTCFNNKRLLQAFEFINLLNNNQMGMEFVSGFVGRILSKTTMQVGVASCPRSSSNTGAQAPLGDSTFIAAGAIDLLPMTMQQATSIPSGWLVLFSVVNIHIVRQQPTSLLYHSSHWCHGIVMPGLTALVQPVRPWPYQFLEKKI